MPISVTCPKCAAVFRLADEMAGKKLKCQKCQAAITVPEPGAESAATSAISAKKPRPGKNAAAPEDADPFKIPTEKKGSRKAKAAGGSGLMIALLLFLGFGLFGCLGCGIFGVWWFYESPTVKTETGPIAVAAADDKEPEKKKTEKGPKDKKKTDGPKKDDTGKEKEVILNLDGNKDGVKDPPPADANKDKIAPPVDVKKDMPGPPPPPGIIPITLGPDGTYSSDNVLTPTDPTNAFGRTHKAYQMVMQAGQTYQIDLVSKDFDSYLFLLDGKNNKITEDDDGGGFPNARIIYQAKSNEVFRIHASHFDNKNGKYTLSVRRLDARPMVEPPPPKPGNIDYRVINFGKDAFLLGDLVWSRDGKSFFVLDRRGILLRVKVADGTIEKQLSLGAPGDNLCLSGEGLLVAMVKNEEVWVVDADDLTTIKRKIPVPGLTRVVAGVNARFAIAGSGAPAVKQGFQVLDLRRGAISSYYKDSPYRAFQATRDGRFLFAAQNDRILKRFRLDSDEIVLEETGPDLGDNGFDVSISPDGQFVSLAGVKGDASLIFAANDLKRPAYTVPNIVRVNAVGLDPLAGFVFSHDTENAVVIHTFAGMKRAEAKIRNFRGADIKEIAVAPTGAEYLLRGINDIAHIRLNFKGEPILLMEPKKDPDPKGEAKKDPEPKKDPPKIAANIDAKNVTHRVIPFKANEGPLKMPVWAADGKSFFVLCKNGALQRINADNGAVDKMHNIGRVLTNDAHLAVSAEGLVLTLPDERQVWVVDPDDLATVKKKFTVGEVTRTAVGRDAKAGVVALRGGKTSLRAIDLQAGPVGAGIPFKLPTFNMRLSADGKYVVLADAGRILRYRFDGQNLTFEESSPTVVVSPGVMNISADGQFVCLAGPVAGAVPIDHPTRGLYIYGIENLKKPVAVLSKVDPGRGVGIDTKGGWIYANETKKPLVIFSMTGVRKGEFPLPDVDPTTILEYVVSPLGQEFLIRTPVSIIHVKIDVQGAPLAQAN